MASLYLANKTRRSESLVIALCLVSTVLLAYLGSPFLHSFLYILKGQNAFCWSENYFSMGEVRLCAIYEIENAFCFAFSQTFTSVTIAL